MHTPAGASMGHSTGAEVNMSTHTNGEASTSHGASMGASADAHTSAQVNAAAYLGKLNAAHASRTALRHAAAGSAVGAIATYQSEMTAALAMSDATARTAAITAARLKLGSTTNKVLTSSAVVQIDAMLGITGAASDLGTTS